VEPFKLHHRGHRRPLMSLQVYDAIAEPPPFQPRAWWTVVATHILKFKRLTPPTLLFLHVPDTGTVEVQITYSTPYPYDVHHMRFSVVCILRTPYSVLRLRRSQEKNPPTPYRALAHHSPSAMVLCGETSSACTDNGSFHLSIPNWPDHGRKLRSNYY
jgi:hypothetical protein